MKQRQSIEIAAINPNISVASWYLTRVLRQFNGGDNSLFTNGAGTNGYSHAKY